MASPQRQPLGPHAVQANVSPLRPPVSSPARRRQRRTAAAVQKLMKCAAYDSMADALFKHVCGILAHPWFSWQQRYGEKLRLWEKYGLVHAFSYTFKHPGASQY